MLPDRLETDPPPFRPIMMAFDSSHTPPSRLDDATLDSVREAISAYLSTSDGDGLQSALMALSSEARAKDVLPEQLLVTLKDLWSSLPEVRHMADHREKTQILQRVVTICIREYYRA